MKNGQASDSASVGCVEWLEVGRQSCQRRGQRAELLQIQSNHCEPNPIGLARKVELPLCSLAAATALDWTARRECQVAISRGPAASLAVRRRSELGSRGDQLICGAPIRRQASSGGSLRAQRNWPPAQVGRVECEERESWRISHQAARLHFISRRCDMRP